MPYGPIPANLGFLVLKVNVEMRPIASLMIGLTAACLGACTPAEQNVYRSSNQQRTIGEGLSVRISNVATEAEALPLADEYCKDRGRMARFNRMEMVSYHHVASNSALFSCVTRAE
jgi:hypothetical protein